MGYHDDDDKGATRGTAQSADSIGKRPLVGLSVGILHITMPSTGSSPSRSTRCEIVKRAFDFLAGDFNMTKDAAEAATQDAQQPARCEPLQRFHGLSRWQLHAIENGRSGDLFKERGMRNDQHDAVAATFWIPYAGVPDAEPPRSPSEPRMLIVIGCSSTLMPVLRPGQVRLRPLAS